MIAYVSVDWKWIGWSNVCSLLISAGLVHVLWLSRVGVTSGLL